MDYESAIKAILEKHYFVYFIIDDNDSLVKIYNLFVKNVIFEPTTECEILHLGSYHHKITKNYVEAEKYYLMAIENGNKVAMYRFALYHQEITKNYIKAEKYYLMAIEKGNEYAMYGFGYYHQTITKNYVEAEKYLLMAIEKGITAAMNNLAVYHEQITKNYVEVEKYYLMGIEKGSVVAMNNLAIYHEEITKNYVEVEKYYLMGIEKGSVVAMSNLALYHEEITKNYVEVEKYYLMAIEKGYNTATKNLINYYKKNNMELKLLRFYINNHTIIERGTIIKLFNTLSSASSDSINKDIFLELLMDFEFRDEDKLSISLELLLSTLKNDVDVMNLHFIYTMNGKGFEDAKKDYFNKCLEK